MIRKILFGVVLAVCSSTAAVAQCIPDTSLKSTGYSPQSLPNASVGVAYKESLSVRTPHDTTIIIVGSPVSARVDSIKATAVKGLPPGFSYVCQHPRCVFLWDTTRCVEIVGTTNQGGVYPIKIMITIYAFVANSINMAQKDSIDRFTLIVDGGTSAIIDNTRPGIFAYPNPVAGKLFITGPTAEKAGDIQILDTKGTVVSVKITLENGVWVADMGSLAAGIYLVKTEFGVKRVEVTRE
jgi:hypothetical protein